MSRALTQLKKLAIFCHRWMGVVFCLLFAWWFISGIFMMYFDYPSVEESDHLAHAQPIDAARVQLTPGEAWASLRMNRPPDEVKLAMFDGRPAYWFRLGQPRAWVYADNGQTQTEFPPDINLRTAARWAGQPASAAKVERMGAEDQWTVGGVYQAYEPLTKYSWPDGQQVYISEALGDVVQYTTSASRLGAYMGPVPHWLYFTPLRRNPRLWSRIVIWASGIATVAALLGLIAGLTMVSPSKRYRVAGEPTSIPFAGPKRLHMILGLFFGIIACTWAFSGMLSMDPFQIQAKPSASRIPEALSPGAFEFTPFEAKTPRQALAEAGLQVRQLEFTTLAGEPAYIATATAGHSRIIPVHGPAKDEFDRMRLVEVVTKASPANSVADALFLNQYDAYYLEKNHELPLPVLRVRLNDSESTRFYIDPKTARIVGEYTAGSWLERWLYHGLHSINLPWLYNHRPAWDITVLILMLGGASLSVTAVIIGFQLVRQKLGG
jgi:hypothetical protein